MLLAEKSYSTLEAENSQSKYMGKTEEYMNITHAITRTCKVYHAYVECNSTCRG